MLFGHQHNDVSQLAPEPTPTVAAPSLNPLAIDPTTGVSLPVSTEPEYSVSTTSPSTPAPSLDDSPLNPGPATPPPPPPAPTSAPTVEATPEKVTPVPDAAATDSVLPPAKEAPTPDLDPETVEHNPVPTLNEPVMPFDDESMPEPMTRPHGTSVDDLVDLKQEALAQLSPLVDKLDQTPEERFRTKMMMLQSTDNQALLKDAYEAAQQITDEKARAQALLDVINEINYFTSLNNNQQQY